MPASSGPYQSRIFNFLHQQSRRVNKRLHSARRQFQVATSWGVQAILHSLSQIFQSSESVSKLHSSKQDSVNALSACQEEQIKELAVEEWHPAIAVLKPLLSVVTSLRLLQNKLLLPSASLPAASSPPSPFPPHPILVFIDRTTAKLESTPLAFVSVKAIAIVHRSWDLAKAVPAQLIVSLSGLLNQPQPEAMVSDSQMYLTNTATNIDPYTTQPEAMASDSQTHHFRIQALIWAAIDYFFGNGSESRLGQTAVNGLNQNAPQVAGNVWSNLLRLFGSKPKLLQQAIDNELDPWLAASDLFVTSLTEQPAEDEQKKLSAFPFISLEKFSFSHRSKKQRLAQNSKASLTASNQNKHKQLQKIAQSPLSSPNSHDSHSFDCRNTQINHAPDWIETKATAMGYVKHPLVQLLEWLDRVLLWLEELLIKVVDWAQKKSHEPPCQL